MAQPWNPGVEFMRNEQCLCSGAGAGAGGVYGYKVGCVDRYPVVSRYSVE
jgi:hypothetical protein